MRCVGRIAELAGAISAGRLVVLAVRLNGLFGDLPADLARRIGGRMDIDVVAARQQVRRLSVGQRRRSLRRACRNVRNWYRNAGVCTGLSRPMEVSGGRG